MKVLRCGTFALCLALVFGVFPAGAQDKVDKAKLKERFGQLKNLLPPDAAEKLNLTAEQKEKLAKLQEEFAAKLPDMLAKNKDAFKKAVEDKDIDTLKKLGAEMREEVEKVRKEFMDKVIVILTDEQKKKLEELKKEQPKRKPKE
jgi:Spy/CpxP family protein refolding chaperone